MRNLDNVKVYFSHEHEASTVVPWLEGMNVHNAVVVLIREVEELKEMVADLWSELNRR